MTPEHLDMILKQAQVKEEKDGFRVMTEGTTLTLHVAHGGAGMSMPRVEAVKRDGDLLWVKNGKKEMGAVVTADVFAVLVEGTAGSPTRRPGFGS